MAAGGGWEGTENNMNKLGEFLSKCFYDMWEAYCESNGSEQEMSIKIKNVPQNMFDHCINYFQEQIFNQECTSDVIVVGIWKGDGTALLKMEKNAAISSPELEWEDCSENESEGEEIELERQE